MDSEHRSKDLNWHIQYEQITPVFEDVQWLPIRMHAQYKLLNMVFELRHSAAQSYLQELLEEYRPRCVLCSGHQTLLSTPSAILWDCYSSFPCCWANFMKHSSNSFMSGIFTWFTWNRVKNLDFYYQAFSVLIFPYIFYLYSCICYMTIWVFTIFMVFTLYKINYYYHYYYISLEMPPCSEQGDFWPFVSNNVDHLQFWHTTEVSLQFYLKKESSISLMNFLCL